MVYKEQKNNVPIMEGADIVVCGGGPSGVMAALAASRAGAKVQLIEAQGCLGGIWTSGLLTWMLDIEDRKGLLKEIMEELSRRNVGRIVGNRRFICESEELKYLLEQMCVEAGVMIQYHTRVVSAVVDESSKLALVITESKSGRQAWRANIYVDATGDGDVGAVSGCGFDIGKSENGETQPMSLIAILGGINEKDVDVFNRASIENSDNAKSNLRTEIERAGVYLSYSDPFLAYLGKNQFLFMANHIYGVSALDAAQITGATIKARDEIHKIVNGLKRLGDPWTNLYIVATAPHIGIREGRRIHGLYTITEDDVVNGVQYEDSICIVKFGIDVHSTNKEDNKGYQNHGKISKPYGIPVRAVISRDISNLLMAGRCISGDFYAHASYRVTGDAAAIGEAVGALAALAAKSNRLPGEIPWKQVQLAILDKLNC